MLFHKHYQKHRAVEAHKPRKTAHRTAKAKATGMRHFKQHTFKKEAHFQEALGLLVLPLLLDTWILVGDAADFDPLSECPPAEPPATVGLPVSGATFTPYSSPAAGLCCLRYSFSNSTMAI